MRTAKVFQFIISVSFMLGALTSCQAVKAVGQLFAPTATNTPTPSPTATATATLPPTPTFTPTPTSTSTPTPTPTFTLTPTPYVPMVYPGEFTVNQCDHTHVDFFNVELCIAWVKVRPDLKMIFGYVITLSGIPQGELVEAHSDENNPNMYITDNLGNQYASIGYSAETALNIEGGFRFERTLEFPAPPRGAITFTFHDDDNGMQIPNITIQ